MRAGPDAGQQRGQGEREQRGARQQRRRRGRPEEALRAAAEQRQEVGDRHLRSTCLHQTAPTHTAEQSILHESVVNPLLSAARQAIRAAIRQAILTRAVQLRSTAKLRTFPAAGVQTPLNPEPNSAAEERDLAVDLSRTARIKEKCFIPP